MTTSGTSTYDPENYRLRTFYDASAQFRDGRDTPRAYLERCLETIEEKEPVVRAWVVLNTENARIAADESSARYKAGRPLSAIDGMPIGIKDVIQTKDMPTALGSAIYEGRQTHMDSASVDALRLAGAIILGKTVTTEFAFMVPGPTTNPFDAQCTPGGSSSGSSAAVGAGMVPAALGNQVVGSIIRPAAYCGNIAIKPTLGALHGGEGLSLSQLHLGVHAGSLVDMWSVAYEIAHRAGADPGYPGLYGPPELAPPTRPDTLIVLETEGWSQCDETTRNAFEAILDQLGSLDVKLVTRNELPAIEAFEQDIDDSMVLCRILCSYEMRWALRHYQSTGLLSDDLSLWLEMAEAITLDDYRKALEKRERMRASLAALKGLASAMITLSAPGPAPELGALTPSGESGYAFKTGSPAFNAATSALGSPALTLPLAAVRGLPLGIQLIGQPHTDWDLTGYGAWLQQSIRTVSM